MENQITPRMKDAMSGASPWMKVLAIIQMVLFGLMAIAGILSLLGGAAVGGLVFIAIAGVMIFASINLLKAGSGFSNYVATNSAETLETGLESLKTAIMIIAIVAIIYVVLILILFLMGGLSGYM